MRCGCARSADLLLASLAALLTELAARIEQYATLPTMAFTHLQPAEPTTVGYRLAQYGYDLLVDWQELSRVRDGIRGKGLRGAVGTSASYAQLTGELNSSAADLEATRAGICWALQRASSRHAGLPAQAGLAGGQRAGRALASRSTASPSTCVCFRRRRSASGASPLAAKQVGSSAMPFKRNPIDAENIDSLARQLAALPRIAWDNAAHSLLERTLDDSANRRMLLPEAFLLTDELLGRATRVVRGLVVREEVVARNMATYGVFAATERLLMEAVKAGGDRQELHEVIREHSLVAWDALRRGEANPLAATAVRRPAHHPLAAGRQGRRVAGCQRLRRRCASASNHNCSSPARGGSVGSSTQCCELNNLIGDHSENGRSHLTAVQHATLILEDGTTLTGLPFGAASDTVFELVFNTSMTGYQEILTDPSYRGQAVLFTASHIGNVGINPEDYELAGPQVAALVVRSLSPGVSNWRASATLSDWLASYGVPGITGVDTRYLTRKLRDAGTMKAALSTSGTDPQRLLEMARAWAGLDGRDMVREVTCVEPYHWMGDAVDHWVVNKTVAGSENVTGLDVPHVVLYDFGAKRNIMRHLAAMGLHVTVVPADTPASRCDGHAPAGVMLSNGPGDPAGLPYAVEAVGELIQADVPHIRHLSGTPTHRARAGRVNQPAEVRPPRRQSSGAGPPNGAGSDHCAEPQLPG